LLTVPRKFMNVANSVLWRMAIILTANEVNLFVSSVLFVFWYYSPNVLDTPRINTKNDQRWTLRISLFLQITMKETVLAYFNVTSVCRETVTFQTRHILAVIRAPYTQSATLGTD
jgi:dolichol kinase